MCINNNSCVHWTRPGIVGLTRRAWNTHQWRSFAIAARSEPGGKGQYIYSIRSWGWDVLCAKTKEHSPRHGVIFIPAFYWVLLNTKPDHTARASNAGDAITYNLISTCCSAAGVAPPLHTLNISRHPQERPQPRNDYKRKMFIGSYFTWAFFHFANNLALSPVMSFANSLSSRINELSKGITKAILGKICIIALLKRPCVRTWW